MRSLLRISLLLAISYSCGNPVSVETAVFENDTNNDARFNFITGRQIDPSIFQHHAHVEYYNDNGFSARFNDQGDTSDRAEQTHLTDFTAENPQPQPRRQKSKPAQDISLVFVFDATHPMAAEFKVLKKEIHNILSAVSARPSRHITEFIWSTFTAKGVNSLTVTTKPQAFKSQIMHTTLDNSTKDNDLCFKRVFSGLKSAVQLAHPNSYVYIFTDALPKDGFLYDETTKIILQKKIRVSIIRTPGCTPHDSPYQWTYYYLTDFTSGLVYSVPEDKFSNVLRFIAHELESDLSTFNFISKSTTHDIPHIHNIYIDDSVKHLTITLAGTRSKMNVFDPNGVHVGYKPNETLLDLPNVKAAKIPAPITGKWTVDVNTSAYYKLRLRGLAAIDFRYCFSKTSKFENCDFNSRPLIGSKMILFIQPIPNNSKVVYKEYCIVDSYGQEMGCFPLSAHRSTKNVFMAANFQAPNKIFFLKVKGTTEKGANLERLSWTGNEAVSKKAPVVKIDERQNVRVGSNVSLNCSVSSKFPVDIKWYKDGIAKPKHVQKCKETCKANYEIHSVTPESEGYYNCRAENRFGHDSKSELIIVEEKKTMKKRQEVMTPSQAEETRSTNGSDLNPFHVSLGGITVA